MNLHPYSPPSLPLTQRQQEIMNWLSTGKSNQELGKLLDISPRTVEKHLENIYRRLGAVDRVSAVRVWQRDLLEV